MFKLTKNQLIKSASYASVFTSIIVMVVKSYGWIVTGSESMLASLVDSLLDISSSFINLIAIRLSLMPPDDNHRFGHEKFQDLAIFSQSIFFFASSMFTLFSSSKALYIGDVPSNYEFGSNIMFFCIALTIILILYQGYVVKKTGSKLIEADKLHYFSDFLTNSVVVISLYLSKQFWYIDAVGGILISLYLMKGSYTLFREAIRNLSDEEFDEKDRLEIIKIIKTFPEAQGVHELKTRCAGSKPFIQFHLELSGEMTLVKAHEISDRIAAKLMKEFHGAEIIIHQDPVGLEKKDNCLDQVRI